MKTKRNHVKDLIDFKIIYVGTAENNTHDQNLEEICLGVVKAGVSKFLFSVRTCFFCSFSSIIPILYVSK